MELSRISPSAGRRGSALLIVLGMLSFIVVSAVAFSVFMRQGRQPSSFLRQRVLARQLVKAALSQAMSDLDAKIGSARHPGVGQGAANRNYWRNRVFMDDSNSDGPYADEETALKNTVATFPLEGLAYIPTPLVNTVRYWARRSPTAEWKMLDYDSGRWAYTAVDVSDYLDINTLKADVVRSSRPNNRISLGYLFENDSHTGMGSVKPSDFDAAMKTLQDSAYGSLVSMADYNLALKYGDLSGIGFKSQFCEFIENPPQGAEFYTDENEAARQKFITGSWNPGTNSAENAHFLFGDSGEWLPDNQPFQNVNQSLDDLQRGGNKVFELLRGRLDICTFGALYDYLDEDSVPISLAIPTIERAPMLTGIRITPMDFQVQVKASDPITYPENATGERWKRIVYTIESLGSSPRLRVTGCGVFPFKRSSGLEQQTSYRAELCATLFFSDSDGFDRTRLTAGDFPDVQGGNWESQNGNGLTSLNRAALNVTGGIGFTLRKAAPLRDEETVFDVNPFDLAVPGGAAGNAIVYATRQREVQDEDTGGWVPVGEPEYDPDGMGNNPLPYWGGGSIKKVGDGMKLRLCAVARMRILDSGATVDLVPAMVGDDQNYNGRSPVPANMFTGVCGASVPVLPLTTADAVLNLNLDSAKNNAIAPPVEFPTLAIYCDDPRYNYAPEDWYVSQNGDVQGSVWLEKARARCDGSDRRPFSIFQFVSDQVWLQSVGELQFLPYVTSLKPKGTPFDGPFFNSGKYDGTPFSSRTEPTQLANRDYAWRSHWAFGDCADRRLDGSDCDIYNLSDGEKRLADSPGGPAVSKYADADLFMAALANTPYDYIVAMENEEGEEPKKFEEMAQYCFNAQSPEARVTWDQLKQIAAKMRQNFRAQPPREIDDWDDWDDPDFFGVNLENFDDVDRKFLFSFWKPCFAESQQLFLIFVRAEPTVIGGAGAGHTPSQLGARAVALVWREPRSTIEGAGEDGDPPHRMRILFYHQFE